jgi:hypothetical protein
MTLGQTQHQSTNSVSKNTPTPTIQDLSEPLQLIVLQIHGLTSVIVMSVQSKRTEAVEALLYQRQIDSYQLEGFPVESML